MLEMITLTNSAHRLYTILSSIIVNKKIYLENKLSIKAVDKIIHFNKFIFRFFISFHICQKNISVSMVFIFCLIVWSFLK